MLTVETCVDDLKLTDVQRKGSQRDNTISINLAESWFPFVNGYFLYPPQAQQKHGL